MHQLYRHGGGVKIFADRFSDRAASKTSSGRNRLPPGLESQRTGLTNPAPGSAAASARRRSHSAIGAAYRAQCRALKSSIGDFDIPVAAESLSESETAGCPGVFKLSPNARR